MPNHVHLIAVPESQDSLRLGIGEAHRRYTRLVNFRENWRGHLWQGRFASFPMDEDHLWCAVSYVEQNSVRAGLASRAEEYAWSSAAAHISGEDDRLVKVQPLLAQEPDWPALLAAEPSREELAALRKHERTGRPLGSQVFIERLETTLGRLLRRRKPGPKGPMKRN